MLPCVVLFLLVHLSTTLADVYTSTNQLNALLKSSKVQNIVQKYIQQEEAKLAILKHKLSMLEEMRVASYNADRVSSSEHPVGVYHILSAYFDINATIYDRNSFIDYEHASNQTFPDQYDLLGAAMGIIRLQKTFKLKARDLLVGNVANHSTKQLEPIEAYHIAQTAYDNEYFDCALDWYTAIYRIFDRRIAGGLRKNVLLHMCYLYAKIPDVVKLRETFEVLFILFPDHADIRNYYNKVDIDLSHAIAKIIPSARSDIEQYEALCRGESIKPIHKIADDEAICKYKQLSTPYDRVKVEVLSYRPYVLFYYDVLTDSESEYIRNVAAERLATSMVGVINTEASTSNIRVSKTSWLFDDDDKILGISKRIGRMTGLSSTIRSTNSDAEATQVVNYGIGGQYEPHMDTAPGYNSSSLDIPAPVRDSGDRLATFLIYLSDVKMGGATVFPRAGLKVDAVKNGALFWYSIQPSGAHDWLTMHAGCPVLLGQKWIANKWFRENGQIFRRPCGLSPHTDQRNLANIKSLPLGMKS